MTTPRHSGTERGAARAGRTLLASLCLCAPPASAQEWWRDAVFYEAFVRSFADSTEGPLANDGVGDLRGLIERLDYLNDGNPDTTEDLGVTALWLMPVCQSPSYHGYDVTDYRTIDDEYGTNDDFLDLVEAAHARGVRVIIDLVINHTSSRHPWFTSAADPGSPHHGWYVWSADPPRMDWGSRVWHDRADNGLSYFGLFWHAMPDLNLEHPDATAAVHDFSRLWLTELRADGFRLDAVKHLIERPPSAENTQESIDWLEEYRREMKAANPDAFLVGEVWSSADQVARYIPGALDAAFEFDLAFAVVEGVRDGDPHRIARAIDAAQRLYPPGQYATFLANHDMQRTMTTLLAGSDSPEEALAKAKLCATIQLTLPGIPFIYYGEEIGMTGSKPDPDLRTPMQWTADPDTAGFTAARPWRPPNRDTPDVNAESQRADPHSLLAHYRTLIARRASTEALRAGELRPNPAPDPGVLAYSRVSPQGAVDILANLTNKPVRVGTGPQDLTLGPWEARISPRE